MTRFCDITNIYWKNPFDRWFFEVFCGYGGKLLAVLAIILLLVYMVIKLVKND